MSAFARDQVATKGAPVSQTTVGAANGPGLVGIANHVVVVVVIVISAIAVPKAVLVVSTAHSLFILSVTFKVVEKVLYQSMVDLMHP